MSEARCANPDCTKLGSTLYIIESNVSGTGVDHMVCTRCQREYYIEYEVSKVQRIDPETAEPIPDEKKFAVVLTEPEYTGLIRFIDQRAKDILDDQEDLGLLLPLLKAYNSRVLWAEMK